MIWGGVTINLLGLILATAKGDQASPASLRFSCATLVVDRIDPLVDPGLMGSPHLHQIMGGNAFNATMDPTSFDPAAESTCTSCTMADDFSNYWTAVMFFQSRNGSYRRVQQLGGLFAEESNGGMTAYYFPQFIEPQKVKIRAFAPGFRMRVGHPSNRVARTDAPAELLTGITYTCLQRHDTRFTNLSWDFPKAPCPQGIMTTIPFPPCWDGKNLDSPDHMSHVAFPESGYHLGASCPPSHPVNIPYIVMEIRWDTRPFNDPNSWPVDGRQPFLWSYGDRVGYGHHADYIFGWKGDLLQRAFDRLDCSGQGCGILSLTSVSNSNKCTKEPSVKEEIDGWLDKMPGGVVADA